MSAVRLTVGWVAAAVAGRIVSGDAEQMVGNIATDSRSMQPGDLFVAIHGPRFDGHAFVNEAIARGAMGAIVSVGRPFMGRQSAAGQRTPTVASPFMPWCPARLVPAARWGTTGRQR